MYKKIKHTLLCGLGIFAVCSFCTVFKIAWPLLWFVSLAPGVIYGMVLGLDIESKYSPALFILASAILYVGCFILVNIGRDDAFLIYRMYLASTIGALLLFSAYYLIIRRNFRFWRTLLYSIFTGIAGIFPASLFCYYYHHSDGHNILLYIGMFTVYPTWQIAFSVLINRCQTGESLPTVPVHEQTDDGILK